MIELSRIDPNENIALFHEVCDKALAESAEFRAVGFDREHMLACFRNPAVRCLAALSDGVLVGLLIFGESSPWYNPAVREWTDLFVWVDPDYRGGSVFPRLVTAFENAAKMAGVKRLSLSQSSGINVEKTAELYAKMGYRITGFLGIKEV